MTDEELKRLESLCASPESLVSDAFDMLPPCLQPTALLAEVRRLRGLIKNAEHANVEYAICPWCGQAEWAPPGAEVPHDDTCPAFTRWGEVR